MTMTETHTPGPWKCGCDEGERPRWECDCPDCMYLVPAQIERLVAERTDLLDALRRYVDAEAGLLDDAITKQARAAIEKAEGSRNGATKEA